LNRVEIITPTSSEWDLRADSSNYLQHTTILGYERRISRAENARLITVKHLRFRECEEAKKMGANTSTVVENVVINVKLSASAGLKCEHSLDLNYSINHLFIFTDVCHRLSCFVFLRIPRLCNLLIVLHGYAMHVCLHDVCNEGYTIPLEE